MLNTILMLAIIFACITFGGAMLIGLYWMTKFYKGILITEKEETNENNMELS